MKTSKTANSIETSLTRQLFNMAKNYDDVIDLTLGDPDIPPKQMIKAAACERACCDDGNFVLVDFGNFAVNKFDIFVTFDFFINYIKMIVHKSILSLISSTTQLNKYK